RRQPTEKACLPSGHPPSSLVGQLHDQARRGLLVALVLARQALVAVHGVLVHSLQGSLQLATLRRRWRVGLCLLLALHSTPASCVFSTVGSCSLTCLATRVTAAGNRSEEHTSELQSRENALSGLL